MITLIDDEQGPLSLVRREVGKFAGEMELKLQKNDYKGGWHTLTREQALSRLKEEVQELVEVLSFDYSKEIITEEAADVANFAMFIHDNFGRSK